MPEENKNLEVTEKKKPGRSWLFWIGIFLIVLAIGWGWFLLSRPCQECYIIFFILLFTSVPLVLFGVFLILLQGFLKIRKSKGKLALPVKIIIILLLFLLFWIALKITPLSIVWENSVRKLAVFVRNEFICEIIPNTKLGKDNSQCYQAVAEKKEDADICDRIENKYGKKECYEVLVEIAKDESVCEKFIDLGYGDSELYRNNCYYDRAKAKKDITLCKKITDTNRHYSCEAIVLEDGSLCERFSDTWWREHCYHDVAEAKKDPSICEKITGLQLRSWCKEHAK